MVFCLGDVGLAATRRRRYTLLLLKYCVHVVQPFYFNHFGRVAFRQRAADARMFFCANAAQQKKFHAEMAAKQGMLPISQGKFMKWSTLLSRSSYQMLVDYAKAAVEEYGSDIPFIVVNLQQTPDWAGSSTSVVPALLRGSKIWLLAPDKQSRPALPLELLSVQCMPVPGSMDPTFETQRPVTGAYAAWEAGAISTLDVAGIAGNSMNQFCVGSVILFGLGSCEVQEC